MQLVGENLVSYYHLKACKIFWKHLTFWLGFMISLMFLLDSSLALNLCYSGISVKGEDIHNAHHLLFNISLIWEGRGSGAGRK